MKLRTNYERNKKRDIANSKKLRHKNMNDWAKLIPNKTNCQICGQKIYFNRKNPVKAIHFDHRFDNKDNGISYKTPTGWLMCHARNAENEKIWKKNKYGMLCRRCNGWLPTKNREAFIKKVNEYVFSKETAV